MIKISTRPALAGSLLLRPAQAIETKRPNILAFRDALQFEAERGYMSTFSKGKIGALMKVAGGICPSLSFFRKSFIWTLTWNCDLLSLFIRLLMDFASSVGRNLIMAHSLPSLNLAESSGAHSVVPVGGGGQADDGKLTVVTIDNVAISVQKGLLLDNSNNHFDGKLADPRTRGTISVSESSQVFNLLLDVLLDQDPVGYQPAPPIISDLLACLTKYGISLDGRLSQQKPFYNFVLSSAISFPLDTFALVCKYDLEELAVESSRYLLLTPLDQLTEEHCVTMGPLYLRRLILLYQNHNEGLKGLLKAPPNGHEPNGLCDTDSQKNNLEILWKDAVSELWWEGSGDIPVSVLQSKLEPLTDQLQCEECRHQMRQRIQRLLVEWTTAVFAEL
ncbi:hypothetical protein FRB91_011532 [Serendipita sp. 411]|nr:hypothetical protein FRB91_011532 [Serendipita sp. 411]